MFSGASAADMSTYTGKVAQLNNQWREFKETLGTSLLPVVKTLLERMTGMTQAAQLTFGVGPERARIEAQIKALEEERSRLEAEQPFVSEKAQLGILGEIQAAKERILAIDDELFVAAEKIREQSAKAAEQQFEVKPPEKDWIKKWVEQFDGLEYSFRELGIESEESLRRVAENTLRHMEIIEKAFHEGKASSSDYINAMKKAMDALKAAGAEDPTKKLADAGERTQKLTDLMIESEEKIRQIKAAGYDEETTKRMINEEIDLWLERKKIIEEEATPTPKIDVSAAKTQLEEIHRDYLEKVKGPIESSPIKIKVDKSELTGLGAGGAGGEQLYATNVGMVTGEFADRNFDVKLKFWGEGSTRKPLSEKIQEIIAQIGGMDKALAGMGALINFSEMTMQFGALEKQLNQIQNIIPSLQRLVSKGLGMPGYVDPNYVRQIRESEENVMSQMGLLQMKMIMELMRGFGEDGFQTGGIVPATGWYRLHKGEQVRTTNQVSMSNGPFVFNIRAGDAKGAAREIEKILKYELSGDLKDAIRRIR
jgi:hypothetical protein